MQQHDQVYIAVCIGWFARELLIGPHGNVVPRPYSQCVPDAYTCDYRLWTDTYRVQTAQDTINIEVWWDIAYFYLLLKICARMTSWLMPLMHF